MQNLLAKERLVEGIVDPQVSAKLIDLRPAILKDVLDEACVLWDNSEAWTQRARLAQDLQGGTSSPAAHTSTTAAPAMEEGLPQVIQELVRKL